MKMFISGSFRFINAKLYYTGFNSQPVTGNFLGGASFMVRYQHSGILTHFDDFYFFFHCSSSMLLATGKEANPCQSQFRPAINYSFGKNLSRLLRSTKVNGVRISNGGVPPFSFSTQAA